jgi:hypothetical protein
MSKVDKLLSLVEAKEDYSNSIAGDEFFDNVEISFAKKDGKWYLVSEDSKPLISVDLSKLGVKESELEEIGDTSDNLVYYWFKKNINLHDITIDLITKYEAGSKSYSYYQPDEPEQNVLEGVEWNGIIIDDLLSTKDWNWLEEYVNEKF